jgi:hypothetical protein
MHTRTGFCLLICCCAALAACTADGPQGPNTTVTTPSVGRPPAPVSAQAALSKMAFTPYAALGLSNNDGLAPGESSDTLTTACMNAAGYTSNSNFPFGISIAQGGLSFAQPWGSWGYLGVADAQQYGFLLPPGSALSALGIDANPSATPPSYPAAEQTAINKCVTIVSDFTNAAANGPLAGIGTLTNDIYNDVERDAAVKDATQAWAACMARNGYSYKQPQTVFFHELQNIYGKKQFISIGDPVSAAARQAQIAAAVADADCTQSTDLAGIYFAVQASYEQQLVNANQQALTSAVQQYRAMYVKEVSKLPAQLKTAKVTPFRKPKRVVNS